MKYSFVDFHLRSPEFFRRFCRKGQEKTWERFPRCLLAMGIPGWNLWENIWGNMGNIWSSKECQGRFFLFPDHFEWGIWSSFNWWFQVVRPDFSKEQTDGVCKSKNQGPLGCLVCFIMFYLDSMKPPTQCGWLGEFLFDQPDCSISWLDPGYPDTNWTTPVSPSWGTRQPW